MLFAFTLLVFNACQKDKEPEIYGVYEKTYANEASSFQVQLTLQNDGILLWQPLEAIQGHSSSSVNFSKLDGDQIRIFNDTDCGTDATYAYDVSNTTLELTAMEDNCDPRIGALSGIWNRK